MGTHSTVFSECGEADCGGSQPVTQFPTSDHAFLQSLPQDLAQAGAPGREDSWRLATMDVTEEEEGQEAG